MLSEERLREIDEGVRDGDFLAQETIDAAAELVAEVRRLRSLFTEEDVSLVGTLIEHAVSPDACVYIGPYGEEVDAPEIIAARDLARRIREAIGHPPTDSGSDDA